ncbi:MAG: undecaprenyl-diphosphate phosphatase [bacterium JZ-2024 1]
MEPWKAIILGIIQGLTEFLPVSSSGHLAIAEDWLTVPEGQRFSLVIASHLGTLCAVFYAIPRETWRRWAHLAPRERARILANVLLASAVTGGIYVLVAPAVEASFTSLIGVGFGFLGSALMVSIFDGVRKEGKSSENLSFVGAITTGLFQGLALFPGVTRSGSVLAGARLSGLSREESVFYSFLLAIPAIGGGGMVAIIHGDTGKVVWGPGLLVIVSSFVTGVIGARILVKLARMRTLRFFQYYCICAAGVAFFFGFFGGHNG